MMMTRRHYYVVLALLVATGAVVGIGWNTVAGQTNTDTPECCLLLNGVSWIPVQSLPEGLRDLIDDETPTQVKNGILMVPIKQFVEAHGGTVKWDPFAEAVVVEFEDQRLALKALHSAKFWESPTTKALRSALPPAETASASESSTKLPTESTAGGVNLAAITDWDIVSPKDPIPSEVYAAEEFQKLFAQASGVNLAIVTEADRPDRHIFIGPSNALSNSNVGFSVEEMGDEDLRIIIRDGNIAIAGGRPRGTLYGVYTFLEDYLGVRFLTYDHTHVPPLEVGGRVVGPVDRSYHPPLEFRWSFYAETNRNHAFAARIRCNTVPSEAKFGGTVPRRLINHSFASQIPTKIYGEEHPEYYALVNGKRLAQVPKDFDSRYTQPCLTNPDVLRIVTQAVLDEIAGGIARGTPYTNVSVSQNDNQNYCRCPKCAAIDEHEGTPMGSLLTFVNAVAYEVAKLYPDVKIGTLAYHYSRKPPKTIKPRSNVQIQLCSNECSVTRPINDPNCKRNLAFANDLVGWGKICDDIAVWYYNVNFGNYLIPMPTMRVIEPNIRFFVANGVRGVFMQAAYTTIGAEFSDLRNYLTSRLLWDPNLSGEALIDEFLQLHYGRAAPPIRRFINLLHDNAEAKGIGGDRNYNGSCKDWGLDEAMVKAALAAFDEAMRLADDDAVRARVEKASICAYRMASDDAITWDDKKGPLPPDIASRTRPYVKHLFELCDKYGVTNFTESLTIDKRQDPVRPFRGWRPILRDRFGLQEGESF